MEESSGGEQTKRCSRCREAKPVEEFSLNRRRRDGRSAWCKHCCQAHYRASKPAGYQARSYPKERNALHPDLIEKRCARCAVLKPIEAFGRNKREPDGRTARCSECSREYWRRKRSEPSSADAPELAMVAGTSRTARSAMLPISGRLQLRADVLAAYGDRRECCGEATPEFLAVDHVEGGGGQHRKQLGLTGRGFYLWLKRQGFPGNQFRLLCHNCNFARGHYGACPHERVIA